MNPSTCLPIKEIVEILTKRVAALEAKPPSHWHEIGNHKHALDSARYALEDATDELNRWG